MQGRTVRSPHRRAILFSIAALTLLGACSDGPDAPSEETLARGRDVFRNNTFGNERFWTDTLHMNQVIESAVDPVTALAVGLKVDADKLPPGILGQVDLHSPATTVALLKLDAVVGVKAQVDANNHITRMGVTCALCHSNVDNSVAPGIGRRMDGWANHDLDPGKILSLSPALKDPAVQAVLLSWGPGRYDARWNIDGRNGPVVIPPAYGLHDVALETYTGEGPISYWNRYVAVTQMHGQGSFRDERLHLDIQQSPDLVDPVLAVLRDYQHSLQAPAPPAGSFDAGAAARGRVVFEGKGRCSGCHSGSALTDAGARLHAPAETGMEPTWAERGTTGKYRTTPLRALWQHAPYFHDGSAPTLADVVGHYDTVLGLNLTAQERAELVEYLKSL
ncbi:c-type cytochrome [Longimicrobium sp.]|uniref:c-type cytochrome n=1 Tax=Longimicrobium sp. TaxID=2029185 RepID=UPI002BD0E734|nr:c-type cytochrome [Longimicrobium sp.]HSU17428.1 c-type cytochrome [Longimicrobium sp.]